MSAKKETYPIEIAGLHRELPLFEIKPGVRIAILNILSDVELVQVCAKALAQKLQDILFDVIVTPESKSIPIAYALAVETHTPYVILRKAYKPYMGEAVQSETLSITTGKPQDLFLDEKDYPLISGKKILVLDDVISTGSTLQGMRYIIEKAGGAIVAESAILTEGDKAQWMDIISLGHLPIFTD
ncbi:MAG: phosphoribosyltransferase family protein [Chloroflexota bacterium]